MEGKRKEKKIFLISQSSAQYFVYRSLKFMDGHIGIVRHKRISIGKYTNTIYKSKLSIQRSMQFNKKKSIHASSKCIELTK